MAVSITGINTVITPSHFPDLQSKLDTKALA